MMHNKQVEPTIDSREYKPLKHCHFNVRIRDEWEMNRL